MDNTTTTNPILPAAGVSRNLAEGIHEDSTFETNDGPLLNQPWRSGPDDPRRPKAAKEAILRCGRKVLLSTMNVQTLRGHGRAEELANCMKKQGIAVCGIQEHRQVHTLDKEKELETTKVNDHYLVTASAWRNRQNAAIGGVGMMLNSLAHRTMINAKRISERIIYASFKSNPILTIIVVYAPTEDKDEEAKSQFYSQLRLTIESVPQHHFLAVLGDFNARLGKEEAHFTLHTVKNDNRRRLNELLEDYQLMTTNTLFEKRPGKLWTWLSPHKTKAQIDYVITRKKWRNSVTNSEAYQSFKSIGSDHRIVSATVRLSLRADKQKVKKKVKYEWRDLANNNELQEKYAVEIKNRFQVLESDEETATERYYRFTQANDKAAEVCLTQVKRKTKKAEKSMDPRVIQAREEMSTAYDTFLADNSNSDQTREEYQQRKAALYTTYQLLEEEEIAKKIQEVEQAHEDRKYTLSWKLITDITGKRPAQSTHVQGDSAEARVKNWYTHF